MKIRKFKRMEMYTMTKGKETEEVKVTELERKIGDTPIAQNINPRLAPFADYICVRDFLPKDAIRRIAVTAREHLRERLVPDDD